MQKEVSIYLDISRIVAALLVFFGHANEFTSDFFGKVGHHASEAVAIFFVLSGFVIAYVTTAREQSAEAYVTARALRIYSVAIPVILVTMILDICGRTIQPAFYQDQSFGDVDQAAWKIGSALLFFGEWWNFHLFVGSDGPYWSLNYEVWYYFIFGAVVFVKSRLKWLVAMFILILVGPRIAVYFPLWLIGVGAYKLYHSGLISKLSSSVSVVVGVGCFAAALLICVMLKLYVPMTGAMYNPIAFNCFGFYNWLYFTATGLAFSLTILSVTATATHVKPLLNRFERPIRWVAGATFTLYLGHRPILIFLAAALQGSSAAVRIPVVILGTLVAVFLLAEVSERRKIWWQSVGRSLVLILPYKRLRL